MYSLKFRGLLIRHDISLKELGIRDSTELELYSKEMLMLSEPVPRLPVFPIEVQTTNTSRKETPFSLQEHKFIAPAGSIWPIPTLPTQTMVETEETMDLVSDIDETEFPLT